MIKARGKGPQHGQVGRSFQVQDPPSLFGLIVVLESDFIERLEDLAATVVQPVRLAHERDDQIPAGGLVEKDFGMAGSDDLATGGLRGVREQLIDLPLAKNLQVRIGLVQQ